MLRADEMGRTNLYFIGSVLEAIIGIFAGNAWLALNRASGGTSQSNQGSYSIVDSQSPLTITRVSVMLYESAMIKNSCKPCPPKPALTTRPLLNVRQAAALESLFKVLANNTRLRMLHAIARAGHLCVGDLANQLGMKPQAISNQLQRFADRGIVESRRDGLQILYSIVDPCVLKLLDQGWCLAEDTQTRRFDELGSAAS